LPHFPVRGVWNEIEHELKLLAKAWESLGWAHAAPHPDTSDAHVTGIMWANKIVASVVRRVRLSIADDEEATTTELLAVDSFRPHEREALRAAFMVADSIDEESWRSASQSDVARVLGKHPKHRGLMDEQQAKGILVYYPLQKPRGNKHFLVHFFDEEHRKALVRLTRVSDRP
jgi:hypothetical protein